MAEVKDSQINSGSNGHAFLKRRGQKTQMIYCYVAAGWEGEQA